jgi:hypothetical protein
MSEDYEVGYGKPPKHTQFKKGQTGNPRGRPKGARNLKAELAEELQECIQLKEAGVTLTVSKQRAMLKSLTARAVQGDTKAATLLANLILRLLDQDDGAEDVSPIKDEDLAILERYQRRILKGTKTEARDDHA